MRKYRRKEQPASIFDDPMIYILAKNSSLIDYDNKRSMFKM
jgi:E3 ubiquitin-protein ligase HUWE1